MQLINHTILTQIDKHKLDGGAEAKFIEPLIRYIASWFIDNQELTWNESLITGTKTPYEELYIY